MPQAQCLGESASERRTPHFHLHPEYSPPLGAWYVPGDCTQSEAIPGTWCQCDGCQRRLSFQLRVTPDELDAARSIERGLASVFNGMVAQGYGRCGHRAADEHFCGDCSNCYECCSCTRCPNCDTRGNNPCSICGSCDEQCCECPTCDRGHRTDASSFCSNCDCCNDHCTCEPEEPEDDEEPAGVGSSAEDGPIQWPIRWGHNLGINTGADPQPMHTARHVQRINPIKRTLAVEIEVAGVGSPQRSNIISEACRRWGCNIVYDGSLPRSGFEINTAPATGDHFVRQVEQLCDALATARAAVDDSCGLHCHVGCKDFAFYDMRRLIILYARLEPALFQLVPTTRRHNNFCTACGQRYLRGLQEQRLPKASKDQVNRNIYGRSDINGVREERHNGARYNALNIHSWVFRSTIESRLFAGTVDPVKIINWGILWGGIVQFAFQSSERALTALPLPTDTTAHVALGMELLTERCASTPAVKAWVHNRFTLHRT